MGPNYKCLVEVTNRILSDSGGVSSPPPTHRARQEEASQHQGQEVAAVTQVQREVSGQKTWVQVRPKN